MVQIFLFSTIQRLLPIYDKKVNNYFSTFKSVIRIFPKDASMDKWIYKNLFFLVLNRNIYYFKSEKPIFPSCKKEKLFSRFPVRKINFSSSKS